MIPWWMTWQHWLVLVGLILIWSAAFMLSIWWGVLSVGATMVLVGNGRI